MNSLGLLDVRIRAAVDVLYEILIKDAYKATVYIDKDTITSRKNITVKGTRKLYKGGWKKQDTMDIVLTIGKPNYEEREKIKRAKKMGQGPIEMTIKYPPKKK